ncbi:MAG TPA: hypothetical protein VFT65_19155 [Candidatus Angelobacter sp.]|nr:hypothetical protein [Candidatus Angelobacter sp.]
MSPVKPKNKKAAAAKKTAREQKPAPAAGELKGWTAIARYLGIPVATAHRWASEGMPVRRQGRFTVAERAEVSAWLGRESHMAKPAHVMTEDADMAAALKESIAAARKPK